MAQSEPSAHRPGDAGARASSVTRLNRAARYALAANALRGREIDYANLFHKDCVAVFPEIGLLLNRIKKSGNSSTTAFLHELAGGTAGPDLDDLKNSRRLCDADLSVAARIGRFHSLVVVRNPYVRTLSAYLDKVAPGTNPVFRHCPGFGETSAAGFERFLRHLGASGYAGNRHFYPQTALLFQPLPEFSCVARLETLAADLRGFLQALGLTGRARRPLSEPHPLEKLQGEKITGSRRRMHLISPASRELIRALYDADFRALGYPDAPPA